VEPGIDAVVVPAGLDDREALPGALDRVPVDGLAVVVLPLGDVDPADRRSRAGVRDSERREQQERGQDQEPQAHTRSNAPE
jgi:hypothetical protein